jgi:hypothetical protein
MKSLALTLPALALLVAVTASFVACGADTNGGAASGGASGNAGKSSTSGGTAAGVAGASASGGAGAPSSGDGGAAGAGGAAFTDRCGGCKYTGLAPEICIYQAGGPGPARFVCATQNPCRAAGACSCIVDQGTCGFMLEGGSPGYCVCDNGLD